MRTDRTIVFFTGVAVFAAALAVPVLATAGSLLSGYGGPGQGSQQLLGSTLIGGSAGGGSGSGASSGGSLGSGAASSSGSPSRGERVQAGPSAAGRSGAGRAGTVHGGGAGAASHPRASAGMAIAYPAVSAERTYLAGAGSGSAGWEAGVLPYVLLALVVVALTGVFTRRLAMKKGSGGHRSLKGWVAGPE